MDRPQTYKGAEVLCLDAYLCAIIRIVTSWSRFPLLHGNVVLGICFLFGQNPSVSSPRGYMLGCLGVFLVDLRFVP